MTYATRILASALALAAAFTTAAPAADGPTYKLLQLDGRIVKWGEPALGRPAHITYAFADGPVRDGRARNCKAMDALDGLARGSGLDMADIERQVEAAFALWEAEAGVTFSRAATTDDADILIGAQAVPRGYAFANVRYRRGPGTLRTAIRGEERGLNEARAIHGGAGETTRATVATIEKSAICLNPEHAWKIGTGGAGEAYDLRYTFAHEIGHAIGLDHARRSGQIMYFKYSEAFAGPQPGDILGLRALYGPPLAESDAAIPVSVAR